MLFKKKNLLVLAILVVVVGLFAGLMIRDHLPYPENQFSIEGNEPFCLSHLFNVDGVVGAKKTDFTADERREIMVFLANLDYKEPLPLQTEGKYGVPVMLEVKKQDESKIVFSFDTNIGAIEYDKDENVLSQNIYTTTEKQRREILKIVGVIED